LIGQGDFSRNTVIQCGMSTAAAQLRSVPRPQTVSEAPGASGAAQALARVQAFVKDHSMRWKDMPGGFGAFEKELHARVMTYEQEMLAEEMARADVNTEAIDVAGTIYHRVLRCEETYMTAVGAVRVMRTLYKDRTDEAERAIVPMELRLGIVEGFWTPTAAKQVAWVVAQMTPKLGEELFKRLGNMAPSKRSLDRLPKALSARWEEDRLHFEKVLRDGDVIPQHAKTLAVSLDGVLAPMRHGGAQEKRQKTAEEGRLTRGPAGYREVGCGTLSFCDAEGEMLSTVRMARMPEPHKATLKGALLASVTAALDERPELRLVKLADGSWPTVRTTTGPSSRSTCPRASRSSTSSTPRSI
jgi:hypothetical protein